KWTFILMGCTFFNQVIIQALRAKGYFKVIGLNTLVCTIVSLPFIFISINYGILAYVLTRYGSLYLRFPYIFYQAKKNINITFLECFYGVKYVFFAVVILVFSSLIIDQFLIIDFNLNIVLKTIIILVVLCLLLFREKDLIVFL